jgi:hypothetical protein
MPKVPRALDLQRLLPGRPAMAANAVAAASVEVVNVEAVNVEARLQLLRLRLLMNRRPLRQRRHRITVTMASAEEAETPKVD